MSRCSSASHQRSPVLSTTAKASADKRSPSSTWPPCPPQSLMARRAAIRRLVKVVASFKRATGRALTDAEAERYRTVQQRSYRKTFLTSGMRYRKFQRTLAALSPEGSKKVAEVACVLVPGDDQ
jgi:hypothetical protein